MRAVVASSAGGPEVLRVQEIDQPEPAPDQILIRVVAAGVNRADLLQRQGSYSPPAGASPIIGLECSGTVAEVGDEVIGWQVGQPCVALLAGGGYAEYVTVPAGQVLPAPAGVDLVSAAGVMEVAATVVSNLDAANLSRGETFLVHGGAGGIGGFAIQFAKIRGATVITTAGSEDKLAHCLRLGADLAVSYRGDWATDVRQFTESLGVDVIVDNMGAAYLPAHVELLAVNGRLVVIGLQGGRRGTLDLGQLLFKRGRVLATSLRHRPPAEKAAIVADVFTTVWPLLSMGSIALAPEQRIPLAEAGRAHELLESGSVLGKLILVVGDAPTDDAR